jgi:hypothetical protein
MTPRTAAFTLKLELFKPNQTVLILARSRAAGDFFNDFHQFSVFYLAAFDKSTVYLQYI